MLSLNCDFSKSCLVANCEKSWLLSSDRRC
jgi:hypothetical protein